MSLVESILKTETFGCMALTEHQLKDGPSDTSTNTETQKMEKWDQDGDSR